MVRRASSAFFCASLIALAACSKPAPPNVVVVVLDTARPDWLSVYGAKEPTSPFLDELARRGTTYERAYSTSSWTLPAHASLFTGTIPALHRATQVHPALDASVPTLAEELSAAGYDTAAFSANPWVAAHTGLARGFARFVDDWPKGDRSNADPLAHPEVQAVRAWLDRERDASKPFFLFVNLIEPHMPYLPPPAVAASFFASANDAVEAANRMFPRGQPHDALNRHYEGRDPLRPDEWRALEGLYRGELRWVDALARAIVEDAEHAGGRNTLVFVLSDHGENLGDHRHVGHVFDLYDSNVRIALLASGPGIAAGAREDAPVQIEDVHATVTSAAGVLRDARCTGHDLRGRLSNARLLHASLARPVISLASFPESTRASGALARFDRTLDAVIGARFKWILGSDGTDKLYDIVADPGELRPLPHDAEDDASEAGAFLERARTVIAAVHAASSVEAGAVTSDPRTRAALESLGYVR